MTVNILLDTVPLVLSETNTSDVTATDFHGEDGAWFLSDVTATLGLWLSTSISAILMFTVVRGIAHM